jgi:uncharacterized Zn-binding protein involved in type VI secretion
MTHKVYANTNSVCSKDAGGKVKGFPDACHSPPSPAKIGTPVPYPNTGFDSQLTKGSTTVFIEGKEIAKRDMSYFKETTGDTGATTQFLKGAASHEVEGRAYFASWSMNVYVEGLNVCRHSDLMTLNHPKG